MTRRRPTRTVAGLGLVVVLALAGAPAGARPPQRASSGSEAGPCAHPFPCGYRWQGPAGPLEVLPPERAFVRASDGVVLAGWVWRPKVPDGVAVPGLPVSTPYTKYATTGATSIDSPPSRPPFVAGAPGADLVAQGYAVAEFAIRGTGDSGGCFANKSAIEQQDQALLVEWLADQPYSSGRVGMGGLSYVGTTPVMAAINNPPALKTIVIGGTILDDYGFLHTPQGAQFNEAEGFPPYFTAVNRGVPVLSPGQPDRVATNAERVCPELVEANTVLATALATGDRGSDFWPERRFIDRVPEITAATFVVHGFQDRYLSGHAFQDDWAWQSLRSAPKRMLVGHWGHQWPSNNSVHPEWSLRDWPARVTAWFDYWLKGWGDEAPGLGEVEFQDGSGAWRRAAAWPPSLAGRPRHDPAADRPGVDARRRDEVLYLSDGALRTAPASEAATFLSALPPPSGGEHPTHANPYTEPRWISPCPDPTRLVYLSDPVQERTLLAGNPFAWLTLSSTLAGGVVDVQLFDVAPDFDCAQLTEAPRTARPLTEGAADLAYHRSTDYRAQPFPIGEPTSVRIDLANLAEVLEPGDRLGVVISHGVYRDAHGYYPHITVHGSGSIESSQLVLPVVAGGFDAEAPTLTYPASPATPASPKERS
jgi:putative CocE/NonD family hydrolase